MQGPPCMYIQKIKKKNKTEKASKYTGYTGGPRIARFQLARSPV